MFMSTETLNHDVDDASVPQTAHCLNTAMGEHHGADIVGWDNQYARSNFRAGTRPPGPGAFLVRNSWGDGGCFWVSYYDRSFARDQGMGGCGGCASYAAVEGVDNYNAIYQHDDLGVTDRWSFKRPRVWGAARFTATADQSITAAAFCALSSTTRYQLLAGPTLRALTLRASGRRWMHGAKAERRQTFISCNGLRWRDATRVRADSGVCIKAFAQ